MAHRPSKKNALPLTWRSWSLIQNGYGGECSFFLLLLKLDTSKLLLDHVSEPNDHSKRTAVRELCRSSGDALLSCSSASSPPSTFS